jgi:septum formation protein
MQDRPIVLASTSAARIALLRGAGIAFRAESPPVDESTITADSPGELALARARAKALSVAAAAPGALIIGSDQVAHFEGEVFGKPLDPDDHRRRLRLLRGQTHTLSTAAVVRLGAATVECLTHARITFRSDLGDDELDAYVATGEGAHCAGGYAVEGLGGNLVATIEGDHPSVLGLPLYRVVDALRGFGWRPSFPPAAR